MYRRYIKRLLDFVLSLCALIVLSPLLLGLTVIGAIRMKGNPFFTQDRPGLHEKIFQMVKMGHGIKFFIKCAHLIEPVLPI